MPLSRNKRNAIALGVVALVLCIIYAIIRVVLMVVSLQSTMGEVDNLRAAAANKDLGAISQALGKAADAIEMADSSAQDPLVQLFANAPFIGSDIRAASVVSKDGRMVLLAAEQVTLVANQLVTSGIGKELLTDSALVTSLRDGMGELDQAVQKLNTDLGKIDESQLHFGLDERIASAKAAVSTFATASARLTPLVQVGTTVLEQPGSKRWFVSIQNLAELRGTGGITGAYAVITSNNGKLKLEEYGSDKVLLKLGRIDYRNFPEELRDLWGVDLGDWRDINASAHAPYAAELLADGWQKVAGKKVDGVLFIGQGVVSQLSGAVGAIDIRGVTVDKDNAVDFFAKDIYAKFTNVQVKDAVVGELAAEMFNRLLAGKISGAALFAAAANDNTGDRVMAWSRDKSTQQIFSKYQVAGEVSTAFGPKVDVTVNNAGGNKLDAYTTLKADYLLGICNVDTFTGYQGRKSRVTVEITNSSPKGLPAYVDMRLDDSFGEARPKGSNRNLVTIYGPVGSEAESISVDGVEDFAINGIDRNRPLWIFDLQMLPGTTKKIVLELVEPINDDNLEKVPSKQILTGPVMLNAPTLSSSSSGECSLR
ncbi:MAG: DUF4012 domain-containing protein [Rhodoluna sp.]